MVPHEKEKQKDRKHIGKMMKTNPNITGAYCSRLSTKNSTVKLCEERINSYRYPHNIKEWG